MLQLMKASTGPNTSAADHPLGNLVEAIGLPAQRPASGQRYRVHPVGWYTTHPFHLTILPPSRGSTRGKHSALADQDSYLVDSASSHMLVSKIKPCMSKYKQLYGETANGSLNQLSFI